MWTNRTGEPSVEVTQACGRAGVGGVAVLPAPSNLGGWSSFERKGQGAGFQMRGLETKSLPRRNGRGPDSSLKRQQIFVYTPL